MSVKFPYRLAWSSRVYVAGSRAEIKNLLGEDAQEAEIDGVSILYWKDTDKQYYIAFWDADAPRVGFRTRKQPLVAATEVLANAKNWLRRAPNKERRMEHLSLKLTYTLRLCEDGSQCDLFEHSGRNSEHVGRFRHPILAVAAANRRCRGSLIL